MPGSSRIYCCDKHGRPYVFRTLDKVRPIAITSLFLSELLAYAKRSNIPVPRDLEDVIGSLREAEKDKDPEKIAMVVRQLEERGFIEFLRSIEKEAGKLDVYSIVTTIYENFRGEYIRLSLEDEAKIRKLALEFLVEMNLCKQEECLYDFIENDLKKLTQGLKEADKIAVKIAVLSMVYESAKRIYLLEKKYDKIKEIVRNVVGSECNDDIMLFLLGSASKLLAIPSSDCLLYTSPSPRDRG